MSYDDDDRRRENYRRDDDAQQRIIEESLKRRRDQASDSKRTKDALREGDFIKARAAAGMNFDSGMRSNTKGEQVSPQEAERRSRLYQEKSDLVQQIMDLSYLPELAKLSWVNELMAFDPASPFAEQTLSQHWQKVGEIRKAAMDTSRGPLSELFRPLG